MFCGDIDMTFNVYESQTALVGILAAWRCVVCGRAERRCPTQFLSTAVVRAAQTALLTRRGGGGESGERGAGGRMCRFGE